MKVKQGFYWHVHHDKLLEYCYDYKERAEYIKKNKPKHEVETRLRLFKPVRGKLPKDLIEAERKHVEARRKLDEAGQKYYEAERKLDEAGRKWCEAWRKWDEAWRKYDEVLEKHKSFLEELHKKECGCKEWNGKELVFNKQEN